MRKGRLIVLYGVNNLGKTTQAKILVDKIKKEGLRAEYLKYPVYDLEPTGPRLNDYLRMNNPEGLSAKQAQGLYAQNRADYQEALQSKLDSGINIIAEDFWGTGVAWGVGAGVDRQFLLDLNRPFQNEDLAFLFEGERFKEAIEGEHAHETDEALTERVAQAHRDLAREYNWVKIKANQSIEKISSQLWDKVKPIL